MHVSDSTLERALLEIYDAQGLRAGGRLSIASLQRAWNRTGLRGEDFRDAVRILMRRRLLEVPDLRDAMDVALTDAGESRMRADAFRCPTSEQALRDLQTLETLRGRAAARQGQWGGERRRAEDKTAHTVE